MADKKGFDLADMLKDVSKLDTAPAAGREQIEYIDIDKIDNDPNNIYKLTQLDALAANIEVVGLQQPLRVRTSDQDPQRVVIVSGHRRRAALKQLVKEGREDLRAVPCIREQAEGSAALQELRLIYANRDTRVISSGELAKQAERVEMLLYQLKEEGFEFPGRMRDYVAQACKISAPKLARLKVIRESLIPAYKELFEQDKLPEQTAYALARLPAEFQQRMASALTEPPTGDVAEKVLKKYNEGWRWEPQLTCPDGKACKRGDVFLRRDCEASYWGGFCGGKTCCLNCDKAKASYSPCERMCSKAKAQRKEASDAKKEQEHKRQKKQGRKYQKETQPYAKRLLRAIDAAGLSDEKQINWHYYDGIKVSDIRKWAAGEFDDPAEWYSTRLVPGECYEPLKLAKLLNCSTDFLMGLTEDIRPMPVRVEPAPEEVPEESAEQEESWDDLAETLAQAAGTEEPVRRIRWENRGRTPPVGKLILTYQCTNDGPEYRPAVWDGSKFQSPNGRKELTGLQYTHWMEISVPGSGESCETAPAEQAEGQLVVCGWMPGGTAPMDPGDLVADFWIDENTTIRQICFFDGTNYRFSRTGAKLDAEVIRWMRLPPTEETLTPGDVTDNSYVYNWICAGEREHHWKVEEVDYDGHNATDLAIKMNEDRNREDFCVEVAQTCAGQNLAVKAFRELLLQGRVVLEENPLVLWCLANAIEIQNNYGDIKLSKRHKDDTERIDVVAAAMNALARVLVKRSAKPDLAQAVKAGGFHL